MTSSMGLTAHLNPLSCVTAIYWVYFTPVNSVTENTSETLNFTIKMTLK